jgi:hypothetical protein
MGEVAIVASDYSAFFSATRPSSEISASIFVRIALKRSRSTGMML